MRQKAGQTIKQRDELREGEGDMSTVDDIPFFVWLDVGCVSYRVSYLSCCVRTSGRSESRIGGLEGGGYLCVCVGSRVVFRMSSIPIRNRISRGPSNQAQSPLRWTNADGVG